VLEKPDLLANRVEAPQKLLFWPGEDQAPVLDAGDTDDSTWLEDAFDLEQCIERAVEHLEHRVTQARVELVGRKLEGVHVADSELDILELVLGSPAAGFREVLVPIDADHAAGRLRETERDRAVSATDIQYERAVAEMWKEEVRVVRGTSFT